MRSSCVGAASKGIRCELNCDLNAADLKAARFDTEMREFNWHFRQRRWRPGLGRPQLGRAQTSKRLVARGSCFRGRPSSHFRRSRRAPGEEYFPRQPRTFGKRAQCRCLPIARASRRSVNFAGSRLKTGCSHSTASAAESASRRISDFRLGRLLPSSQNLRNGTAWPARGLIAEVRVFERERSLRPLRVQAGRYLSRLV